MDVVEWLLGMDMPRFLLQVLGRQWVVQRNPTLRVHFSVEDNLRLLKDFDPAPGRLQHCQKMQRYSAPGVPVLTSDWADGPLKFWSAIMCRLFNGVHEDVDDEARIAAFLADRELL